MSEENVDRPDAGEKDPTQPIDLGGIAGLFQKWPGPTLMAVGAILMFAAAGIRVGGLEFSDREFAGFEFAAVFLGGVLLIGLGLIVLLVRERLLVADEERRLTQAHEVSLEATRAAFHAGTVAAAQVQNANESSREGFAETYRQIAMGTERG